MENVWRVEMSRMAVTYFQNVRKRGEKFLNGDVMNENAACKICRVHRDSKTENSDNLCV